MDKLNLDVSHYNSLSIMQAQSKPASASDFVFYHSEGDDKPLASPGALRSTTGRNVERGMSYLYSLSLLLILIAFTMVEHVRCVSAEDVTSYPLQEVLRKSCSFFEQYCKHCSICYGQLAFQR